MTRKPDVPGADRDGHAASARPASRVTAWVTAVRADKRRRRLAIVGGVVVGLLLAWVHWTGLVVAGGLVGLTCRRLTSALVAGLAVGVIAVVVTVAVVPAVTPGAFIGLTPVNLATVGVAVILPVWGSLVRYVI